MSFNVSSGGAVTHDRGIIGAFGCDAALNITFVHGEISERLDCLPSELQGYGWEPFVQPADFDVTRRMAMDLQMGRAGIYDLRAQPRSGDPTLYLRIRTLMLQSSGQLPTVRGVLDLRHAESRRTIILPD